MIINHITHIINHYKDKSLLRYANIKIYNN